MYQKLSQYRTKARKVAGKMMAKNDLFLLSALCTCLVIGCSPQQGKEESTTFEKGTFGYDYQFLSKYYENLILLQDADSTMLLISPEVQGRVMTSTANGFDGKSFGWINYELIASQKIVPQMNPVGGEERIWLGPEGGQFTYFFKPGDAFTTENWSVPKEMDTEPFDVISTDITEAVFTKEMNLVNYSNNALNLRINRKIKLLGRKDQSTYLNIQLEKGLKAIGFESQNTITNLGPHTWTRDYGMPSIWILSMMNPSLETVIILPFKPGPEKALGPIVNDVYFGKVSADRLVIIDSTVFFKGDGMKRGKIGISPIRSKPVVGSFDAQNNVLTIAQFTLPNNKAEYVNSLWELQEDPFSGDAVNAYNDGPMEDGTKLGPFYEIESSSPAANLSSGESKTHIHRTYHFTGDFQLLNSLSKELLGVELEVVKAIY